MNINNLAKSIIKSSILELDSFKQTAISVSDNKLFKKYKNYKNFLNKIINKNKILLNYMR